MSKILILMVLLADSSSFTTSKISLLNKPISTSGKNDRYIDLCHPSASKIIELQQASETSNFNLADFEAILEKRVKRLETIAQSFTKDKDLKLVMGDNRWVYNSEENILYIPSQIFSVLSEEASIALILRECAFRCYSRPSSQLPENLAFKLLYYTIERIRLQSILTARHSGYHSLCLSLDLESYVNKWIVSYGSMPQFKQFCLALINSYINTRSVEVNLNQNLSQALLEVKPYIEEVCVLPLPQEDIHLIGLSEAQISEWAKKSEEILIQKIWPIYLRFLKEDLQDIDPSSLSQNENSNSQDNQNFSHELNQQDLDTNGSSYEYDEDLTNEQQKELQKLVENLKNQIGKPQEKIENNIQEKKEDLIFKSPKIDDEPQGDQGDAGEERSKGEQVDTNGDLEGEHFSEQQSGSEINNREYQDHDINQADLMDMINQYMEKVTNNDGLESEYDALVKSQKNIIQQFVSFAKHIFQDEENPQLQGYYRSGVFDLQKYIESKAKQHATGVSDNKVFMKRELPNEKDVEIVVCLDTSGSMGGERMIYARRAVIIIGEMLHQLKIKWGLLAFSIDTELIKHFDDESNEQNWKDAFMKLEAFGGTNDLSATKLAVELLSTRASAKKIVFMITDGQGEKKQPDYLKQLAKDQEIIVIGIGIGDQAEFVKTTYVNSVYVENVIDLPHKCSLKIIEAIKSNAKDLK